MEKHDIDCVNTPFALDAFLMLQEKTIRRQWITIILLVVLLVGSNLAWLYYESQFENVETTTTVTQDLDSDSGDAIINDGVHINGENKTDSKNKN